MGRHQYIIACAWNARSVCWWVGLCDRLFMGGAVVVRCHARVLFIVMWDPPAPVQLCWSPPGRQCIDCVGHCSWFAPTPRRLGHLIALEPYLKLNEHKEGMWGGKCFRVPYFRWAAQLCGHLFRSSWLWLVVTFAMGQGGRSAASNAAQRQALIRTFFSRLLPGGTFCVAHQSVP